MEWHPTNTDPQTINDCQKALNKTSVKNVNVNLENIDNVNSSVVGLLILMKTTMDIRKGDLKISIPFRLEKTFKLLDIEKFFNKHLEVIHE